MLAATCLPLPVSSIHPLLYLSPSPCSSAQCCVWQIDLQPLFLSLIHLPVHPLSHKPTRSHARYCSLAPQIRASRHTDSCRYAAHSQRRGSAWRFTHVTVTNCLHFFGELLLPTLTVVFDFLISDPLMAYNHRWADSRCWLIPDALFPRYHHWFCILFSLGTSLHWFILEFKFLPWLPGVKG